MRSSQSSTASISSLFNLKSRTALTLSLAQIFSGLLTSANAKTPEMAVFGAGLSGSGLFSALYALEKNPSDLEARRYVIECFSGSIYQTLTGVVAYLTSDMNAMPRIALNTATNAIATILSELPRYFLISNNEEKEEKTYQEKFVDALITGFFRTSISLEAERHTLPYLSKDPKSATWNTLVSGLFHGLGGAVSGYYSKLTLNMWHHKKDEKPDEGALMSAGMEFLNTSAAGAVKGYRTAKFG